MVIFVRPEYHPNPREENNRLEQQLRQFAQKYGIDFDDGSDAAAVLQEVERRARTSGERSSGRNFTFASLLDLLAASLRWPGRLGLAAPVTQPSIPPSSATLDTREAISLSPLALVPPQFIMPESRSFTKVRDNVGQYRFWAVLIGIDAYKRCAPLRGCVSDALLIKQFLTDDLGVPENRIQCLLGPRDPNSTDPKSTPSRANIIDTLYSLADNPEIERGDNIIIYYAGLVLMYCCTGHDSISQCDDSCCIEALCPIDRGTRDGGGPDISDRELNFLFALICRAKGHNITFIVDSEYGGRLGRRQLPTPHHHHTIF